MGVLLLELITGLPAADGGRAPGHRLLAQALAPRLGDVAALQVGGVGFRGQGLGIRGRLLPQAQGPRLGNVAALQVRLLEGTTSHVLCKPVCLQRLLLHRQCSACSALREPALPHACCSGHSGGLSF